MGKVNFFVYINSDCVSTFQGIPVFVCVCGCAHGCARVGKRHEPERLMLGGGCAEDCIFKFTGS